MMVESSVFYILLNIFLHICCERGAKSHVAKEIPGRGRTRSCEKGNQGVGDFRFINTLQLNFFYCFFFNYFTLSFFSIPFLPTKFTHTHHPQPQPTTHDPRHLATLLNNPKKRALRIRKNISINGGGIHLDWLVGLRNSRTFRYPTLGLPYGC